MKADVLLEVTAKLVTSQVITEAEALTRNQLVDLLSDRAGQQRLQTIYMDTWRAKNSVCDYIFTHN